MQWCSRFCVPSGQPHTRESSVGHAAVAGKHGARSYYSFTSTDFASFEFWEAKISNVFPYFGRHMQRSWCWLLLAFWFASSLWLCCAHWDILCKWDLHRRWTLAISLNVLVRASACNSWTSSCSSIRRSASIFTRLNFWEFKKRRCYTWRLIPQSFQHDSIVPEWNPCIGFQVLKAAAYRRGLGVHITVLES